MKLTRTKLNIVMLFIVLIVMMGFFSYKFGATRATDDISKK